MGRPWVVERVLALASDEASVRAARVVARSNPWLETGSADTQTVTAVWGICEGSGLKTYRVVTDLTGPAYKCTCPSRKLPCKHALALLLHWSEGKVTDKPVPPWAAEWLEERAAKSLEKTPRTPDPVAQARRAEQREARVSAGLDELDQWLSDQVRTGLAGLTRGGYAQLDAMAARMVDAQAQSIATKLRRLSTVGPGWTDAVLAEYGMLRLLVRAHRRLGELPAPLAAAVRAEIGYPVSREDVLATPPVTDTWQVLGWRDSEDTRIRTRRIWLRGARTGRPALILSFAANGQLLDNSFVPGEEVVADLHFYPASDGLRALAGNNRGEPQRITAIDGKLTMAEAAKRWSQALAANPWLESWPVLLSQVTPVHHDDEWLLVADATVPLYAADPWPLLAVSGGRPVDVLAEWTATGVRVVSALTPTAVVSL
ncbi:SWIM zinc finger family protein [Fodinicola acaciae]|uniref:SWIM zinc finger family protein n=1 Tax=Fodinicola acaciae TaxID=2681555 RepID=UPI001C9E9E2C|nr:SWIM zinc finger family protein [Fodinicola acaciae]